jgi:Zn-dependent protease with chaperone function
MFKVLLWLAPVVALLFFYISQKQEAQVDDMKAEFAKFDEDFARMSEGLSSGSEKAEWGAVKADARERYKEAKERSAASQEKVDDTFAEMEKELGAANPDDFLNR